MRVIMFFVIGILLLQSCAKESGQKNEEPVDIRDSLVGTYVGYRINPYAWPPVRHSQDTMVVVIQIQKDSSSTSSLLINGSSIIIENEGIPFNGSEIEPFYDSAYAMKFEVYSAPHETHFADFFNDTLVLTYEIQSPAVGFKSRWVGKKQ